MNRWRILVVSGALFLSGCAPSPPLPDAEWCAKVRNELNAAGIGWPIANQPLDGAQLDATLAIFSRADDEASGHLETAARAWTEGFAAALPYLRAGDKQGFESDVSPNMKSQLHLANAIITNTCQWFDDAKGKSQ
jgi:hypothetical protein